MKSNEILLFDFEKKLSKMDIPVPKEIKDLASYIASEASILNKPITPEVMVGLLKDTLIQLFFGRKTPGNRAVMQKKSVIVNEIKKFQVLIENVASEQFSQQFSELYDSQIGSV